MNRGQASGSAGTKTELVGDQVAVTGSNGSTTVLPVTTAANAELRGPEQCQDQHGPSHTAHQGDISHTGKYSPLKSVGYLLRENTTVKTKDYR